MIIQYDLNKMVEISYHRNFKFLKRQNELSFDELRRFWESDISIELQKTFLETSFSLIEN